MDRTVCQIRESELRAVSSEKLDLLKAKLLHAHHCVFTHHSGTFFGAGFC